MTAVFTMLAVLAPLTAALFAWHAPSSVVARSRGITGMLVGLGATLVALVWEVAGIVGTTAAHVAVSQSWTVAMPAFVSSVGLCAVALSPASGTSPMTFARTLMLVASSVALVVLRHPLALAVLWSLSLLPVWFELRAQSQSDRADPLVGMQTLVGRPRLVGMYGGGSGARLFGTYLLPSAALVFVAGVLFQLGMPKAAVFPLVAGVVIRQAMIPFHSWLPRFVERAPLGLAVAFVAPQLGVYTQLQWVGQSLPAGFDSGLAALGAVTALFAALMGTVQTRARRALGYLMMSETAVVSMGLLSHSAAGRAGALAAWLLSGLAITGLAMTTAGLEARRGALSLERPSGSFRNVPLLATAYLVLGLAGVGVPGTLGFIAEDLLVQGAVETFPLLGLILIATTSLNGVTVVRGFFALFTGSRRHFGERDLTLRERVVLTLLIGALLICGLWPGPVVHWLHGVGGEVVSLL